MGHRVSKLEKTATGEEKKTLYSLDAQGNTMATYHYTKSSTGLESLSMGEWTIYGSKRIGIEQGSGVEFNPIKKINNTYVGNNIWDEAEWEEIPVEVYPPWQIGTWDEPNQVIGQKYKHSEGDKRYELANHLGNVLNVVTDRKLPVADANDPSKVAYFTADVVSFADYLPFGQVMPNRHGDDNQYRYGYQGSERDDELKGDGESYVTHYRMLDPRLGRWLSIDPKGVPWESPFVSMGNNPILHNDIFGDSIRINGTGPNKEIYTLKNDKYYDSKGFEYVSGTDKFVDDAITNIDKISKSGPEGDRLISSLSNREDDLFIKYDKGKHFERGAEIHMDFDIQAKTPTTRGTVLAPSFITLAHELAHGEDFLNGTIDFSVWPGTESENPDEEVPMAERYSTHIENKIRAQSGLPLRTHYSMYADFTPDETTRLIDNKGNSYFYKVTTTYIFRNVDNSSGNYNPIIVKRPFNYKNDIDENVDNNVNVTH